MIYWDNPRSDTTFHFVIPTFKRSSRRTFFSEIPNFLSPSECDTLIKIGQKKGLHSGEDGGKYKEKKNER